MNEYNEFHQHSDNEYMKKFMSLLTKKFNGHNVDVSYGKYGPVLRLTFYTSLFRDEVESFKLYLTAKQSRTCPDDIRINVELQCFRETESKPVMSYKSNSLQTMIREENFEFVFESLDVESVIDFCRKFNQWNENWIRSTTNGYKYDYVLDQHDIEQRDHEVNFKLLFV